MIKLISVANLVQIVDINHRRRALSRKFNVSFHILCSRRPCVPTSAETQKGSFHPAISHLLPPQRASFAARFAANGEPSGNQPFTRAPQSPRDTRQHRPPQHPRRARQRPTDKAPGSIRRHRHADRPCRANATDGSTEAVPSTMHHSVILR